MSYNNFIPNVWNADLIKELQKLLVFADGCWNVYSGNVTKKGESITFESLGKPTIHDMNREDADGNIASAEKLEDVSLVMPVKQIAYYNVEVGDLDKKQSNVNIWGEFKRSTAEGIADQIDQYVAALAKGEDCAILGATNGTPKFGGSDAIQLSKNNIMEVIDEAVTHLFENNVPKNTALEIIIPPFAYTMLKQAYQNLDTDNSEVLKNGRVGIYNGITVKMSNNVAKDASGNYRIMLRTKKACGFANPFTYSKAYEPDNKFTDALKGYSLYDAKVLRPKEMVIIKATK